MPVKFRRPNRRKAVKMDKTVLSACESIRDFVENLNASPDVALRGGTYKALDPTAPYGVKVNGFEIMYKIIDKPSQQKVTRQVAIIAEQPFREIGDEQLEPVLGAVYEAFFDKGQSDIKDEMPAPNHMIFSQEFLPMVLVEKSPGLVSISNMPTVNKKPI